jgi:hypothetical protein
MGPPQTAPSSQMAMPSGRTVASCPDDLAQLGDWWTTDREDPELVH